MEAKVIKSQPISQAELEKEREMKERKRIEEDFKEAFSVLRSNPEWTEVSDALSVIQKTVELRPELLNENLHDLMMCLCSQVSNLRSTVSKIAINCLNDMFIKFEKQMDIDLDMTVSALLKK